LCPPSTAVAVTTAVVAVDALTTVVVVTAPAAVTVAVVVAAITVTATGDAVGGGGGVELMGYGISFFVLRSQTSAGRVITKRVWWQYLIM
jgi:hypothetical protein